MLYDKIWAEFNDLKKAMAKESRDYISIYDSLCRILTDYETIETDAASASQDMYFALVDLVNEMAEKLN